MATPSYAFASPLYLSTSRATSTLYYIFSAPPGASFDGGIARCRCQRTIAGKSGIREPVDAVAADIIDEQLKEKSGKAPKNSWVIARSDEWGSSKPSGSYE